MPKKRYTFELTVLEGNDEFWEDLEHKCGADEVKDLILSALDQVGLYEVINDGQHEGNIQLTLKRFEQ